MSRRAFLYSTFVKWKMTGFLTATKLPHRSKSRISKLSSVSYHYLKELTGGCSVLCVLNEDLLDSELSSVEVVRKLKQEDKGGKQ